MKKLLLPLAGLLAASLLTAVPLLQDTFSYTDGPLAGNGTWARGVNSPSSDNPSDYIVVSSGAVLFDWTTATPINNVVRSLWASEDQVSGTIMATFELTVTTAPAAAANVRPGFFCFADSAGSQQRGFVAIQAGSVAGTFNLGIANNSQLGGNYVYDTQDLALNTSYQVMVTFDTTTTSTKLWIGTTDPEAPPQVSISAGGASNAIRRVNMRMYNSDGAGGTTNLGIFKVDNLAVEPLVIAPPPPVVSLPFGDAFAYVDGPLSGQGAWVRGVTDPAAENPSNYIAVNSEQVTFDWTTPTQVNNALRVQWEDEELTAGVIYAAFDLLVTQAPQPITDGTPGFLQFDRSGGGQMRGHVGIQAGSLPDTFQLGISPSSQFVGNFTFAAQDLDINTTYRVMVGYDAATSETRLWIGSDDPQTAPAASAIGSPSVGVRRIQLRLYNYDFDALTPGTNNLGIFHLDNLLVQLETILPVLQISKVADDLFIQWDQPAGQSAVLEYNSALSGTWTTIDTYETTAAPASFDYTDATWDGLTPRFYRLNID